MPEIFCLYTREIRWSWPCETFNWLIGKTLVSSRPADMLNNSLTTCHTLSPLGAYDPTTLREEAHALLISHTKAHSSHSFQAANSSSATMPLPFDLRLSS